MDWGRSYLLWRLDIGTKQFMVTPERAYELVVIGRKAPRLIGILGFDGSSKHLDDQPTTRLAAEKV